MTPSNTRLCIKPNAERVRKGRVERKKIRSNPGIIKGCFKPNLSSQEIHETVVSHLEYGKRLAWSFLSLWRVKMVQDEVGSVVGLALCEAASRFDSSKGVAFKTFFFYHLRGLLLKEISRIIDDQKVLYPLRIGLDKDSNDSECLLSVGFNSSLIEGNSPESIIERKQAASTCWEACAKLDPLEQEVLIRSFVYDEPLIKVSNELNYCRCHISRVKRRALHHVAKLLRQALDCGEFEECRKKVSESVSSSKNELQEVRLRDYTGGRGRRKPEATQVKKSAILQMMITERC